MDGQGAGPQAAVKTAVLRPDRNFDTIACRSRSGLEAIARLEGGAVAMPVPADWSDRIAQMRGGAVSGAIFFETISLGDDGRLHVAHLRRLLQDGTHEVAGRISVVDNSAASPYLCRPLQMGADVVLEDLGCWSGMAGLVAVARSERAWEAFCDMTCPDGAGSRSEGTLWDDEGPLLADIRTLSLRAQRRCDTAQALAHYAAAHPSAAWVSYPGLPDDVGNDAARRTLEHGFGARLTIGVAGEGAAACGAADAFPESSGCDCTHIWWDAGRGCLVVEAGLENPFDAVEMLEAAFESRRFDV